MSVNLFDNLHPYLFITKYLVRSTKPEALPIICIKQDDPKQGGWTPIPLNEKTILPDNANLYICISSCRRLHDPSSKFHNTYRASIECASQTHMFMLDDIKGKRGLNKLPLEPTWIIETSKNNYQCLYVLETPLDDIPLANQITKELPAKVNADPSAKNCVRWARLPGGRNNKPEHLNRNGKGFAVRIHTANPDLLYSIDNITSAFLIPLTETPLLHTPLHNSVRVQDTSGNAPIIGNPPTGWERYLSALFSIDANCDYSIWFNAMVAMHAWKDQGYIAFEEWSHTSTNPEHQKLTNSDLRSKWDTVKYDSSDTRNQPSVIGWAWLQRTAMDHGWSYEDYSTEQREQLTAQLRQTTSKKQVKQLVPQIKDAYLNAADLDQMMSILQASIQIHTGKKESIAVVRKMLIEDSKLDAEDSIWTYSLTDQGNVYRLASLYEGQLYYIEETKTFIVWNEDLWTTQSFILEQIFDTIKQIPYMENRDITTDQEKQLKKWRTVCGAYSHIRALGNLVRDHLPLVKQISDLNTHKTIIGMPSGVLNLDTGIQSGNTPDHLITMHTNVDVSNDAKCPRWDQFILEIMNGQEELATFLQRLAGYALYGGNPEQLFIILEGHGANGKTTFVNVLQHVFGNYAATASADTLTRPAFNKSGSSAAPDIVRLYRKRLVICNEWNEGTYINESLIKVLSGGGDEISVRALYSNKTIDYIPEFIIFLATNHRPNIAGMDYGLWRRLLIIPFEVNFTDAEHIAERDPHLEQYLKDNESAGILNWLIDGYHQWQQEGIGTSVETGIPEKLINIKQEYHLEMDTVGQYLQEQTENAHDNEELICMAYRITSSDLYRSYNSWAAENGYKAKGSKSFSQAIKHRGFKAIRVGTARGFEGIRLLTPSELLDANPRTIDHDTKQPTVN